jgi:hypothetical protein
MNAETLALLWHVTIDSEGTSSIFDVNSRLVARFVDPHVAGVIVELFNALKKVSVFF